MKRLFALSLTLGMLTFSGFASQAYAQSYITQPTWNGFSMWGAGDTSYEEETQQVVETEVSRKDMGVLTNEVILGMDPIVVPYGMDGTPLKQVKTSDMVVSVRSPFWEVGLNDETIQPTYVGECVRAICPQEVEGAPAKGVSSEMIEALTPFSVDRLSAMPNGDVMVTYSAPFHSDEVLVIDDTNVPNLMTVDTNGTIVQHPTRRAALHENQILLIDNNVNLSELQDNPMPTSIITESTVVYGPGFEREVSLTSSPSHTPVSSEDFSRPLPVSMAVSSVPVVTTPTAVEERIVTYDRLGNPIMIEVSQPMDGQIVEIPGEIPVAFTSSMPEDRRAITVGNGVLLLDDEGVIRDIFPANF